MHVDFGPDSFSSMLAFGLDYTLLRHLLITHAHQDHWFPDELAWRREGYSRKLEDCPELINEWTEAALKVRKDVIVLCHGGPIAMPEDAAYVLKRCKGVNGFYGASSMERLPTETAIKAQTQAFKAVQF